MRGNETLSLFSESLRLYAVSRLSNLERKCLELNRAETYRPLWLFVFATGKLDVSIPGAQTSDQHQRHNLNKSKHGLPCFVVCVFFSAKLSRSFPKQYYNSQNVAE